MVLCRSQDGACTGFFENFRDNSFKGGLSKDITLNPPLFSLVNTFKLTNLDEYMELLAAYKEIKKINKCSGCQWSGSGC